MLPPDAPESEKDKLLGEQAKTIRELEIVVKGYEDNLGEPLRKVKEDVEREWAERLEKEVKLREEKSVWADELVKQLEKERKVCGLRHSGLHVKELTRLCISKVRMKLEEERQALAAFVKKFDALGLGALSLPPTKLNPPLPTPGGAAAVFAERQRNRLQAADLAMATVAETESPIRVALPAAEPSLLEEQWDALEDVSFEAEKLVRTPSSPGRGKENLPVP